jgi:hypothetical protein
MAIISRWVGCSASRTSWGSVWSCIAAVGLYFWGGEEPVSQEGFEIESEKLERISEGFDLLKVRLDYG